MVVLLFVFIFEEVIELFSFENLPLESRSGTRNEVYGFDSYRLNR